MDTSQALLNAARNKIRTRLPEAQYAVAAAVLLDDGSILSSIGLDNINAAANLCAETGALCEAFNRDRRVLASLCVVRQLGISGDRVLAPCGICQERLALWDPNVLVGVADPGAADGWSMKTLSEVNPFYWAAEFAREGAWPSAAQHSD